MSSEAFNHAAAGFASPNPYPRRALTIEKD
jgi:hypothetical protein